MAPLPPFILFYTACLASGGFHWAVKSYFDRRRSAEETKAKQDLILTFINGYLELELLKAQREHKKKQHD